MGKGQRGDQYEAAMDKYNKLNDQYARLQNQYTGNAGYQNSLNQAAIGAGTVAQNQAAQTQASARNNAGMTRAQAAAMGQNAVNSVYGNQFQNQQNQAYNAGSDALSAQNTQAQNQITRATTEQNENTARNDRTWGNVANVANGAANVGKTAAEIFSDENLKCKKTAPENFSKCLSAIDSFIFKYTDEAQKEKKCDDNVHCGVIAQELEKCPATEKSVRELEDGTKVVDTKELTMENTSLLADINARLEKLEKLLSKEGE